MKTIFISLFILSAVTGSSQNVGIGTATPVTKLNIVATGNNPSIPGNSSTGIFRIGVGTNEGVDFGKLSISPFSAWMQAGFNGTASDPLSLQPMGGNVGIGIISPTEKVDVDGNIRSSATVFGLNITATQIITAGTGLVITSGEVNRTSTGTANLVPIAYGNISSTGFIQTGSGNFTVSHTITGFYQITITGEAYQFQQYITVVTPVGTIAPRIACTGSGGGALQVSIYDITGADVDANFHFVVYKQ